MKAIRSTSAGIFPSLNVTDTTTFTTTTTTTIVWRWFFCIQYLVFTCTFSFGHDEISTLKPFANTLVNLRIKEQIKI